MFRKRLTFLLLALNLIALGAIFLVARAEETAALREERLRQLASTGSLVRVAWSGPARPQPLTLELKDGAWWLPAPESWPANPAALEALRGFIQSPRPIAIIELSSADAPAVELAEYGLAEPDLVIEVQTDTGSKRIALGKVVAAEGPVYALPEGERHVRALARSTVDLLLADRNAFRDPTLLSIPAFEARALSIQFSAGEGLKVRLAPTSERAWRFESPLQARADRARVERLFERLNALRPAAYLAAEAAPDAEAPAIRLTLDGNNRQQTLLLFGPPMIRRPDSTAAEPVSDLVIARLEDRPGLFILQSDFLSDLENSVANLRDRRLVPLAPGDVESLSIALPERPAVNLRRTEAGAWQVLGRAQGNSEVARAGDSQRIESLIARLTQAQIIDFSSDAPTRAQLEDFGLTSPQLTVVLTTRAGSWEVQFGRPDSSAGRIHVRVASEAFVYTTGLELLAELPSVARAYRDRSLRGALAPEGGVRISLLPMDSDTPLIAGTPAAGETSPLAALARELAPLRARQFLADGFEESSAPAWTHRLRVEPDAGGEGFTLLLRRSAQGAWTAGSADLSAIFEPTESLSKALDEALKPAR